MAQCMFCSTELTDGAVFCHACGKKQVKIYQQTFQRGNMNEETFIANVNQWFATYPRVANVKAQIHLRSAGGLMVNKYKLEAVSIEYELLNGNNINQYALVSLSKFGLTCTNTDTLVNQWRAQNPGATVIARNGGVHQRGQSGSLALGGFGASNNTQVYLLFKYNRQYGTAQLPPVQQ